MAESTLHTHQAFQITRTFNAPREKVWQAWTDPEQLSQWWGPKGHQAKIQHFELKPGGMFHYAIEMPGMSLWGRFIYQEIIAPEKLVFINSFSDEQGNVIRSPFPNLGKTWPLETLSTIILTEHEGKTTVSMSAMPIHASDEEHAIYESNFGSMQQGWTGTLDQLAAFVE